MAKFGDPIDLTPAIWKRSRNRVYRVGIEVEGGWTQRGVRSKVVPDGSVFEHGRRLPPTVTQEVLANGFIYGEIASEPREVIKGSNTDFRVWMAKYYPQIVDETCGMHVHVSFPNPLLYGRCMDPRFPATIVASIGQWANEEGLSGDHPLWPRLQNQNRYCKHDFDAENQITPTGKDYDQTRLGNRYTVVNYCYGRTTTWECRLLPMMATVEQGIRAVERVIDTTNAFLVATAKRETKHRGVVGIEDMGVSVTRTVRL